MQRMIDAMTALPTIVQNERLDIVASNQLGRAFYSEMYVQPRRPVNFRRFIFLDPRSSGSYRNWDDAARQTVALLRSTAGRAPYDRVLSELVGELATRSDYFRTLWAAHDVRLHRSGLKEVDQSVIAYTAEPGSLQRQPGITRPTGPQATT